MIGSGTEISSKRFNAAAVDITRPGYVLLAAIANQVAPGQFPMMWRSLLGLVLLKQFPSASSVCHRPHIGTSLDQHFACRSPQHPKDFEPERLA